MNQQFNQMSNMMSAPNPNMMFGQNPNMMQNQFPAMGNFYPNQNFNPYMAGYQNMYNNPNMMMGMQFYNPAMNNMYMQQPGYGCFQGNNPMMQNNMNNMNNTPNTSNNNTTSQQETPSLLSRDNKIIGDLNLTPGEGYINVYFEASTGNTVVIHVKDNIGLRDALKLYMEKMQLSESFIGTHIVFLFNGRKLDHDSNESIKTFKIGNSSKITVFDQGNVIGA